jgi:hypothetical protein
MHVFNVIVICTQNYTYTAMSTEEVPESGHKRLSQLFMLCVVCCRSEQRKANSFIPSIQDKQWRHVLQMREGSVSIFDV